MMRASPRIGRRWLAGGAALALAGCASLFVAAPPGNLYRLASVGNFPTDLRHVRAPLLIELPQAPAGIDTDRIALSKSPISLDYYADSVWTDPVPELLKNLLVISFENSEAITAFDRGSIGLRADFILQTEIRHFEAIYETAGGPPRIWVAIIARLVALPQRTIVAQMRFGQRVSAAANNVPAIVTAFNSATDAVLRQVVLWTLNNLALSQSHR
jgi:cholesterol transport system auxiliary component